MILALLFSFFILYSSSISTQIHQYMHERKMLRLYQVQYETSKLTENEKQIDLFEAFLREPTVTYGPKQKRLSAKQNRKPRMHFKGGINLYSLLNPSSTNALEKELFLDLLASLNPAESRNAREIGCKILKELRAKITFKKSEAQHKFFIQNPEDLAAFVFENSALNHALYTWLKGSQVSAFNGGSPSIYHSLVVHRWSKTQINLYEAPYELLCVLFDHKTADYILENKSYWKKGKQEAEVFGQQVISDIETFFGQKPSKYHALINYRIRSK